MTETNKDEVRRIEITGVEIEQKEVLVDFEFGSVLVNFNFRESDLPMLKKMLAELEKEFAEWEASLK